MTAPMRNRRVVLLAEDDPGDQELMRRALDETGAPCELRVVQDGEEALDYLMRRGRYQDPDLSPRPGLILLDLNMPRLDGLGVLREMRRRPDLRILPSVVLSTSRSPGDVRESYALAARSYLTKPHTLEDYTAVVKVLQDYWFDLVVLPQ